MRLYAAVDAPRAMMGAALDEDCGLVLEDLESLLEARELRLAAALPLLVGLRLGDAHLLDLRQRLQDGIELRSDTRAVRAQLRRSLVEVRRLLGLVLHVLLLRVLVDLVV